MFEAHMSSGVFQLHGMADLRLLPSVFSGRATCTGTPWVAITTSTAVTITVSFLSFDDIVATDNFLYSLGTLLEFSSFLWLRAKYPTLKRPYQVPLPLPVPSVFLAYVCGSWVESIRNCSRADHTWDRGACPHEGVQSQ
ncbi:hypothetical protein VPH35_057417 [Triticum aestivum]